MNGIDEKSELKKRLWAPYESIKSVVDIEGLSKDQIAALEESIVADLVGDEPELPIPYRRLNKATTHYLYSIMHLYSSIGRFATYRTMFSNYPWRGRLSKSDHIQSAYYLFVHECYILEERLKVYFRAAEQFVDDQDLKIDIKSISKKIMKLHKSSFGTAIRSRGVHVHQDDFLPNDIKRLGLFDLLLRGEKFSPALDQILRSLQRSALRSVKKNWILQCDNAEIASEKILALAFDETAPAWKRLGEFKRRMHSGR